MKGFAVLNMALENDIKTRHPIISRIWGVDKLILPYREREYNFNRILGAKINVPSGLQRGKIKRACKIGERNYGYVVSKDFNINYNPFFHHSCLIRALDFLTVGLGCDLRLNEVVIADAASYEGRNAFRLLLPIARRIVLVTSKKEELRDEVNYAIMQYGTSVALVEDPVKASERADIVVMVSDDENHKYIANLDRPMLYFRSRTTPASRWWFNDVDISFNRNGELSTVYAQGYLDVSNKKTIWSLAERDGFEISSIRRDDTRIIQR